ncbi:winged helix-turn-helix transcriptional regulator [Candidatus Gracilibacteria bacterium]|nr:winged helix-turn-helix transcriptional regulator [Candidatus Gracilibacteria bacterium]
MNFSSALQFFIELAKTQAVVARRFDCGLGGLGFSEFVILHHLQQAKGEKMRRIDLAEKIGLTASGVTRLLAPMEKIGLVKRESNELDARVSYVAIAPGGKRKLTEALEDAEDLSLQMMPSIASLIELGCTLPQDNK